MMIVSPRRMVLAAFAWLMCLSCLLASVGCQKKMPGRLDGLYSSDTASDSPSDTQPDETSSQSDTEKPAFPSPTFQAGSYDMESASTYEHLLLSGSEIRARIAISQTYNYRIKLTVSKNGNMTAVYTFTRIRTSYEDSQTDTTDTADKKGRTEENAPYYALIGQSFTVRVTKDYRLSISGVDKIHRKYPDTADIVTDENLLEVASDLFYPIEEELSVGSAWKRTQNGVTYTVSKIREDNLLINIKGDKLPVPEPVIQNDITYTYRQCAPLSGSVVMNRHNRMIQEQSSYQSNTGDAAYNGAAYAFEEASSSLCSIVKAS
ncbi:MAG: hypothetical protein IIU00_03400 [Clostridia bacterium]|nr:hypothetical protein [Clostridia bacterium]